jgi:lipid A ethanolaminephosphotransferase
MLLPSEMRRPRFGPPAPPSRRLVVRWPVEAVLVLVSLFWTLAGNRLFLQAALQGREAGDASAWGFGLALGVGVFALNLLLLGLLCNRWSTKPVLVVLIVATAFAMHFMQHYGVYLDPSMLRNVMRTDVAEAGELFGPALAWNLFLYAVLPLLLLWRVDLVRWPWRRSVLVRLGVLVAAFGVLVAALMSVFQPLASLMRNQKELRYLITPSNYLWSLASVAAGDARAKAGPRQPIGTDAAPGATFAARQKPMLLVMVVGETARAANWGLNGYARQTTPRLAQLPVINFPDVTSCGTNTEVSLPCMFAPVGRRNYDEATIRGSQSLLHVLARAGVGVTWRDNQSGCKGVCEGLPTQTVMDIQPPGLCNDGRCLDEGLLHGLDDMLRQASGTQMLVLHQLGNHGPSYFRRYPPAFAKFQPVCDNDDLRRCSREQIVNAYDNALLYTDEVLARLIEQLRARQDRIDSAVLYVSDHGESLGENNLFLHGIPYAIAPDVQKQVPMVMWFSEGFAGAAKLDMACLKQRATQPAAHDHLFHTVLGLLDVRTALHQPAWDLTATCRQP